MEGYVENLVADNTALKRKLQSKTEALFILTKELDDSRKQRDQFKLMAEQLQQRYSALKKKPYSHLGQAMLLLPTGDAHEEKNKSLKLENEELKQKLRDAYGDMKALRTQIGILKSSPASNTESGVFPAHQKEEMVQQLEALHIKSVQLRQDLQSMLDEKEELIVQRDTLRSKVHRLNFELKQVLLRKDSSSSSKDIIDIDALVAENSYLHDRLQQMEQEKQMAEHNLNKYKSVIEKSRNKGAIKLGSSGNGGLVVSQKQVEQLFLQNGDLPRTPAAQSDLHSLYLALLEALNDKNVALAHQKKTNRILGKRIAELERRLEAFGDDAYPSKVLLNGYSVVDIDKEVDQILAQAEEKNDTVPDSSTSDVSETSEAPKIAEVDGDDTLPPNLQQMVLQALNDIRRETSET
ncbi:coiled-coil domain-containing protein 149 [Neocloeon triangulifer]|uniref:coiled-coil domain-containing protein 149 n=1 Tax=Neocloeon triangulifer TaxID=2078957 RepID=UPI00286F949E|nr:coiled-coil domain-containing protein 149 [Neocloeon triangulifer]